MDLFVISPTEALLIGLSLEEFLQMKKTDPKSSFLTILGNRLGTFIPDLWQMKRVAIDEADIPGDIEWLVEDESMKRGISHSNPNRVYGLTDNGAYYEIHDMSRNNVVNLVSHYVIDLVALSPFEKRFHEKITETGGKSFPLIMKMIMENGNDSLEPSGEDDVTEIETRIEQLASYNEVGYYLQLGRWFGAVVAAFSAYEKGGPGSSIAEMVHPMRKLIEAQGVKHSTIASTALLSICGFFKDEIKAATIRQQLVLDALLDDQGVLILERGIIEERLKNLLESNEFLNVMTEGEERRDKTLKQGDNYRMALWVAVGEILGYLRDVDREILQQDSESSVPRAFKLSKNDPADKIRKRIEEVEQELNVGTGPLSRPENIVVCLSGGIEALSRRKWPKEFQNNKPLNKKSLADILHAKLHSTLASEARFASIAMCLHKAYRNPANHAVDAFHCSLTEARFFLLGIRTLLDLLGEPNA